MKKVLVPSSVAKMVANSEKTFTIKELYDKLIFGEYGEDLINYSDGIISDEILEHANSAIDCYSYQLIKWARSNKKWLERAFNDFGLDNFEIKATEDELYEKELDVDRLPYWDIEDIEEIAPSLIIAAQYMYYSQDFYDNLEDILFGKAIVYLEKKYKIKELTESQIDDLEIGLEDINHNSRFDEVDDIVDNLIDEWNEKKNEMTSSVNHKLTDEELKIPNTIKKKIKNLFVKKLNKLNFKSLFRK